MQTSDAAVIVGWLTRILLWGLGPLLMSSGMETQDAATLAGGAAAFIVATAWSAWRKWRRGELRSPLTGPPVALILAMMLAQGCATSPIQRYAALQETYIAVVGQLLEARQSGAIDADTWGNRILPMIEKGDALLDDLGEAARAGRPIDRHQSIEALRQLLRELLLWSSPGAPHGPRHDLPVGKRHVGRCGLRDPSGHNCQGAAVA